MNNQHEPSRQLNDIRDMMLRSSRFISLSGLSGISAGLFALAGAAFAYFILDFNYQFSMIGTGYTQSSDFLINRIQLYITLDGLVVLLLALISGIYFTTRQARRKGLKVWDNTARRLLINLFIPLIAGGVFCLVLFYYGLLFLIPSATLVFYGLALIHASKYTYSEVRMLGVSEAILGLISAFFPEYSLIFWIVGFGLLHIVYGSLMYTRYEKAAHQAK